MGQTGVDKTILKEVESLTSKKINVMKLTKLSIITSLLFFMSSQLCNGQVLIRPTALNNPFFKLEQLFKMQLVNTTNEPVQGIVEVRLEDNFSSSILQIQSWPVTLQKGQSLNAAQIEWKGGLDLANQQFAGTLSQTGQLPSGQYVYCYRFVDSTNGRTLGSHCQESALLNYQPPSLIYPQNEQTIPNSFPVLSWRPPLPLFGDDLNYTLRLVELEEGQSTADAIYSNLPLLEKYGLKRMSLVYPVTAIPLEKGQRYAWQVQAFWQETKVGETAVWEFTLDDPVRLETPPRTEAYRMLKRQMDPSVYLFSGNIHFAYKNLAGEKELNYQVYPMNDSNKKIADLPKIELVSGLNQIDIEIGKQLKLKKDQAYVLEVTDQKKRKYFLGFRYIKNR